MDECKPLGRGRHHYSKEVAIYVGAAIDPKTGGACVRDSLALSPSS